MINQIKQTELTNKLDIAFEAVLYALLAFMPFAFGVVHAWSELIVLLAAAVLLVLQAVKFFVDRSARPVLSWVLLPVAVFLLVPVFQLIPLPAGVVRVLSPNTCKTKTELLSKLPAPSSSLSANNQLSIINNHLVAGIGVAPSSDQLVGGVNSSLNSKFSILNSDKMSLTFYPYATWHGFRLVLAVASIFLVTLQYFTSVPRIKRLLACITVIGGIAAILAVLQNITRTDKIFWVVPTGHSIAEAGPFVNHNNFGQFMNLSIGAALAIVFIKFHELFKGRVRPLSSYPIKGKSNGLIDTHNPVNLISDLADYLTSPQSRWFWFVLAMVILSAASVFLSLTRGGMLTLLIAAAFTTLLLTTRGSIRGRGWIMALMALGAFICVLWIGFDAVYDRLATLSEFEKAQGGRWQIVQDIATAWTKFPIFGTGLNTHLYVYPMFDRATIPSLAAHAENEYAQLAEEMGLMGLTPMLLFGILVWFTYVRCIRRSKTPVCSAAYGLGFGLLAIMLHSLSDFGQHLPANASLTAIFCALLIVLSKMTVRSTVIPDLIRDPGISKESNLTANFQSQIENRKSNFENNNARHSESPLRGEESIKIASHSDSANHQSSLLNNNVIPAEHSESRDPDGRVGPAHADIRVAPSSDCHPERTCPEQSRRSEKSTQSYSRSDSTINHYSLIIIHSILALVLLWLIFSPQGAWSASSAEKNFTAARKTADYLEQLSWQGSAAQFADLLRVAQQASKLQPENIEYCHWLNVWRWRSMSRLTDAAGNVLLPPQGFGHISRLVDEFCTGIRSCPVYGQSWTVAGQLLYFVLEPQAASAGEASVLHNSPSPGDSSINHSSIINNHSRTTGASMIRTGYQLAPCDATVCFVAGLLEVTEFQRNVIPAQAGTQNPGSPEPANNINHSSLINNQSESAPGFFYFSRCLQLDGRFFNDIAAVYLGIDRPDLVVELAADDINRLNTAARLLSDSDSEFAQAARQKVFDLLLRKSESPDVTSGTLASLAAIYAKEGKTTEAIDLYRRALTLDYGNVDLRYQLAVLLGKVGDIETAIKECKIILRLRPDYTYAIQLIEQLSAK